MKTRVMTTKQVVSKYLKKGYRITNTLYADLWIDDGVDYIDGCGGSGVVCMISRSKLETLIKYFGMKDKDFER